MYRGNGYRDLRRVALIAVVAVSVLLAPPAAAVVLHKRGGHFFGISVRRGSSARVQSLASSSGALTYHGGPVLQSTAPYLIFWLPTGESLPPGAQSLMSTYFADVAADTGRSTNVFGVGRQYYDGTGIADYVQTFSAGQVIVDTTNYPATDPENCPDVNKTYFPKCLTDTQLQTEIAHVISARGLPRGNAIPTPIYFLVTPANVNVCTDSFTCADNLFCAYHSTFDDQGSPIVYAAIPFFLSADSSDKAQYAKTCQNDGNAAIEEPNGNLADVAISYMSHEDNEAITDPFGTGWFDDNPPNNENGDNCISSFQPTLGGSSTGTLYDQLINGHAYYTQAEWSNGGSSCEMQPGAGVISPGFSAPNAGFTAVGAPQGFDPSATTSTNAITSARWSFGDGPAAAFQPGALNGVTHTYAAAGRYRVTLSLVDDRGNVASTTQTITIGSPPFTSIALSPGPPLAGTSVSFAAAGTFDADPGVTVASYGWAFGDGASGTGPATSHLYTAPGIYTVSLTVTNSLGLTRTVFNQLIVAAIRIVSVSIHKHRYRAVIRVTVNGPGTLSIGRQTKTATAAGTKKLVVWLTPAQLRTLARHHRLTLHLRIRFAPRFGPGSTRAVTIRFRR
jgi:PKD repeat protein